MNLSPTLFGELISLRPLEPQDFEALYKVASDPLIWEQLPQPDRYKREVFTPLFAEWMKAPGSLIVMDQKTKQVIGTSRYYELDETDSSVAIGYTFLARAYWGHTFNREMKALMLGHAFASVNTVFFHIAENNIRSQKAITKIGARFVTKMEREVNGKKLPYRLYEIRKSN